MEQMLKESEEKAAKAKADLEARQLAMEQAIKEKEEEAKSNLVHSGFNVGRVPANHFYYKVII